MSEDETSSTKTGSRVRTATIELHKDYLHFSAAHFTIFSATERENLHGHNFQVAAFLEGPINDDGLCFDYNEVKTRLKQLCDSLDETVLLPAESPHIEIENDAHTSTRCSMTNAFPSCVATSPRYPSATSRSRNWPTGSSISFWPMRVSLRSQLTV